MFGYLSTSLKTVAHKATNLKTKVTTFTKPLILITGLVIALLSPAIATTIVAHADASCSPNGVKLSGSSWLSGGGVNICNNGSSAGDDYGSSCVAVSGALGGTGCKKGYLYAGEEWQCVELVNRLYLTKGWISATWYGNGNTLINNIPSGLTKQNNGLVSYVNPGDVITLDDGGDRHAGIINSVESNSTIHIKNQIADLDSSAYIDSGSLSKGNAHYHMNGWKTYKVQAIIHHPFKDTGHPLYQFVNSGSGWHQYNITYSSVGTTYNIQVTPSVIWGSTINVFGIGPSGQLLQYSLPPGGSWFPYTLSTGLTLAGGVSAIQVGSTLEVFATGANGHLYQFVNSGSGWNWYDLTYSSGGTTYTIEGSPSVVWGSTINVYAAGTNGELLQYSLPSGGSWFPYTLSANNTVTGGVTATQVGSSLQDFATGTGGHLLQFSNSGSGWTESDVTYGSYTVTGGPSLIWGNPINVFTVGSSSGSASGKILQYSLPSGGSWFPYTINSTTPLAGGMSAVLIGSTFEVFGD